MEPRMNREHKDRLFKRAFMDKRDLLQLYNAVNGTDYDNPDDLIINTLEDAIYMGMKNDVSFIIDDILNLYEHQSTFNPNMPLRGLFYITNIYKGIVGTGADIYSSKIIPLPMPKYVVFYNGVENEPEQLELSIRDAFEESRRGESRREESCLEFKATMLNINLGNNEELMNKCKRLRDYAVLISRIREYVKQGFLIEAAVDRAVDDCIHEDILADILSKNRTEVFEMILTEYNEQNHIANEKKISLEQGIELGRTEGEYLKIIGQVHKKLAKNISPEECAEMLEEDIDFIKKIYSIIELDASLTDEDIVKKL